MKNIEFWFTIGSTYTYLSVTRILDIEKKHQENLVRKKICDFNWLKIK